MTVACLHTALWAWQVFTELVPGGEGAIVMTYGEIATSATADADAADAADAEGHHGGGRAARQPTGVAIRVRFAIGGDTQSMSQLSGGQKTMVALCLIFAIQRCDPAPFYIFDEIDAALDATHRASLAAMITRQAALVDETGQPRKPTQFITTTFRPELLDAGQQVHADARAPVPNTRPVPHAPRTRPVPSTYS